MVKLVYTYALGAYTERCGGSNPSCGTNCFLVYAILSINAVAPGATATPGTDMSANQDLLKQTIANIPLNRMGTPQDIAYAVSFLLSEKANYITGQIITVDVG